MTPKPLGNKPIHRWYIFPHSFTGEMVYALCDEWGVDHNDNILDPFAGAGTTLLAAKEKGIPATAYDISPLAVLASRVKCADYDLRRIEMMWQRLRKTMNPKQWDGAGKPYPELVQRALPGKLLGAFDGLGRNIADLGGAENERDFFRLALLATLPSFSRAVAAGGWLRWVSKRNGVLSIPSEFSSRVERMLEDLRSSNLHTGVLWRADKADARSLPDKEGTYSAVITSPPYPNRHDYTRVFGVELMFGFMDWEQTRRLRYQSFHSHPEARPERPMFSSNADYVRPRSLARAVAGMRQKGEDRRIIEMIDGYFLDMYLVLREAGRVCRRGARLAFVVGNAQYRGVAVPVDEITAEVGEQAGLECKKLLVARYRGNSAQQMGKYGRHPSRESVVVFRKP
ncbi:MAG: hypothetical protein HY039_11210 [Nitrospirae bacterium]|nr:hypothetical protein [Nitrospirota bacterium]